ncbi:MAG TPA: protein-methionine-sulfoxide reductase heme-binding subunit MsrQ [Gammaproteobacteria bacterium]|nr:protein-methionine-sulfoxide reductase heme-binding subunit MsrQ [Gammaproteobacteria bacterium]
MSRPPHNHLLLILRYLKPTLFLTCLLPLALLVWDGFHDALGANPIETITHRTGDWTLRFLLITLTMTPLRRLMGWNGVLRLRRMLGLFAFFYACLHFLTYLVLDQFFDWDAIIRDIAKRPYITIGFSAFVLLIPLAVTSTKAMMRRLGRRWGQLHRLTYLVAIFGVIHYLWLVKADYLPPALYASVLAILLGLRLWWWRVDGDAETGRGQRHARRALTDIK